MALGYVLQQIPHWELLQHLQQKMQMGKLVSLFLLHWYLCKEREVSSLAWAWERLGIREGVPDALTAMSALLSSLCKGCSSVVCLICESRRGTESCGVPGIAS